MSIIYVLIPLAILLVALAIGIFFWAVRSNQFDDLERQGYSILFDDDLADDKQTEQQDPKSAPPAEQQTKTSTHD
ncbi:cbb3-type cytochrome oxidase assembly protein CcoS [Marisediminitalea sp.]|uniref:cbb3-type cytochrome oxidase assembly protein CcoS n=1 Tax=Marisediminitalea sp. TaxID=2662268 RepID=UPI002EB61522|nr:cbb3-type cytochrome oxidase assembly protein CcoS [Aestuariibacter sp.]MEC7470162.1 cbb3-type cytochrome oxidase assembly protein CcoS [Pseudomonadota bacterium]MEC7823241.1 cbb3-type cytochrome oxidase assembly protein CcoS [Pseudomonadota bacterium]